MFRPMWATTLFTVSVLASGIVVPTIASASPPAKILTRRRTEKARSAAGIGRAR